MTKLNYTILLIVLLSNLNSFSQKITNVRVSQEGTSVGIMYDLTGKQVQYNVTLFYTIDDGKNWQGPLNNVTGDVAAQLPGKDKKALWNAAAEKGQLEGTIQFRLDAKPIILPEQVNEKPVNQEDVYTSKEKEKKDSVQIKSKKPIEKAVVTPDFSADYNKFKKSKTIWLASALGSCAVGTVTMVMGNSFYNQYKIAANDATSLHQKVAICDVVAPIAFVAAGLCTVEFIIKAGKQNKAKKQALGFYPQPINQGVALGLVYSF